MTGIVKGYIVPNKAFITEQFINWSLSDSDYALLTIPAPADANSEEGDANSADGGSAVLWCLMACLEIFQLDLQQGIPDFSNFCVSMRGNGTPYAITP